MLKKWWGPNFFSAPTVKMDFQVGGKYLLCMSGTLGPNGPKMENWSGGTYKEIVPMSKIVLVDHFADENGNIVHASKYGLPETFPMESEITISFEKMDGGKTKMTVHYANIEGIEGLMLKNMTQGWNETLDKLGKTLENN